MPDPTEYLHTEDGRVCRPAAADPGSMDWRGPGESPAPGQWIFGQDRWGGRRRWPCNRTHDQQLDPLPMVAVTPPPHGGGRVVHLMLPGYKPAASHKAGPRDRHPTAAMCGQLGTGTIHWDIVQEKDKPTGREHWPVSVAAAELARVGYLRWCYSCVGRAAEHFDVLNDVVRLVIERDLMPTGGAQ